jgi:hypothetical protein
MVGKFKIKAVATFLMIFGAYTSEYLIYHQGEEFRARQMAT